MKQVKKNKIILNKQKDLWYNHIAFGPMVKRLRRDPLKV